MTGCPLCGTYARNLSQLLVHMRLVHAGEPGFQVTCGVEGCPRTFRNFLTFRNHVYAIHGAILPVAFESNAILDGDEGQDQMEDGGEEGEGGRGGDDDITEEAVQRAAALFILKNREGHRIPQSVMDEIVTDVGSLFHLAMCAVRQKVNATLTEAGVDEGVVKSTMEHLSDRSPFTNVFNGLGTHHRQLQYFKKNFDLVVSLFSSSLLMFIVS